MMEHELVLNVENVLKSIRELLIGWVNAILYFHEVYPKYIFESYKSFNIIVYKSRSPRLNQYIDQMVDSFLPLLTNSHNIDELSVILYTKQKIHYKYSIKFNEFIKLGDKINPSTNNSSVINHEGVDWQEIYKQFNSFLFYHVQNLQKLQSPTIDLEFKVLVNTNLQLGSHSQWVSTETQVVPNLNEIKLARFKPLQEVSVGFIKFSSYYQYD